MKSVKHSLYLLAETSDRLRHIVLVSNLPGSTNETSVKSKLQYKFYGSFILQYLYL
jgi:hypothetical protein